ncbi:MAG: Hsp20 family protein [Gemmatimonadetes bacterium]|nr:Hsp20/alpha crystallin family protein [Gemmatimonadota bacterium]NIW74064.1 Hsp20 family protein [Gemmatimonadota bacterium]
MSTLMPWRSKSNDDDGASTALSRLHDEVDHLFGRFFEDAFGVTPGMTAGDMGWAPLLDVSETDDEIRVSAEIPGIDPKEFDVSVTGNVLTISGEKKEESEERKGNVYRTERRFGTFRRSITLPDNVDTEKVSADYDRGVLTVHLPKTEKATAKRIPVSASKKK